ncbi:hypothetical protein B9N43_10160 [Denitratisoma sp. DHT3]|uniref:glycosyltransferase family 9 protein n=1 Tax=Denitratisoma sp. DHT3 TaxID=1981880 RepID=UPI001198BBBF|nr:glycosyltransferase family 9 protein [Denitratisoma sp. DHT3]QDX81580.1 hypothetical protein B9N43_10160 [Denitratisoma sp. DHT3]
MIQLLLTWLAWPLLVFRARLWARLRRGPVRRVLVIQLAKIGDAICSTPVLRAIDEGLRTDADIDGRGVEVHVLASPLTAPLFRLNPHVAAVREFPPAALKGLAGKRRLAATIAAGDYDAVVCLNAGLAYPLATLWAGVPIRLAVRPNFIGTTYRLACGLWTATAAHRGDRLIMETYLDLVARLGVSGATLDKEVFAASDAQALVATLVADLSPAGGQVLGIGVSSANKLKELGSRRIAAVAAQLLAARPELALALIGATSDHAQGEEILALLDGSPRVRNLCGALALEQMPALLQRLDAYLGVDSGITYMADAVGTPLVSVAGPCNMQETRPLLPASVILQKPLPCAPCAHIFRAPYRCATGTHDCIRLITDDEIVAAVERVLSRPRR